MKRRDVIKGGAAGAASLLAGCSTGSEETETEEQPTDPSTQEAYTESTAETNDTTPQRTEGESTEEPSENTPNSDEYDIPRPNEDPVAEQEVTGGPDISGPVGGDTGYRLSSRPADFDSTYDCESDVIFELLSDEDEQGARETIDEATMTPNDLDVMLEDTENDLINIYIDRLSCDLQDGSAEPEYRIEIYTT